MAHTSTCLHVYEDDRIVAGRGDTRQWLTIGELSLFASTPDLERIKAAIDDVIAMRAELARAA